jgi:hypothetical protein
VLTRVVRLRLLCEDDGLFPVGGPLLGVKFWNDVLTVFLRTVVAEEMNLAAKWKENSFADGLIRSVVSDLRADESGSDYN